MVQSIKKTIPNLLTITRILISFLSLFLYFIDLKNIAIYLYIFGAFTDLIDGMLARSWNVVTKVGSVLDQFADKLFSLSVGIWFILNKDYSVAFLIIIEVIIVIILVTYFILTRKWVQSSPAAKTKTFFLFFTIMLGLLRNLIPELKYPYIISYIITVITGIYAIYDYSRLLVKLKFKN